MAYTSDNVGTEILAIFKGTKPGVLTDLGFLEKSLKKAVTAENFKILGELKHEFESQDYTRLIPLQESAHLGIHTYPEHNSCYLNYGFPEYFSSKVLKKFISKTFKPHTILDEKIRTFSMDENNDFKRVEISCIVHGIDEAIIKDNALLEKQIMAELEDYTILDESSYINHMNGGSVMVPLADSHAIIHADPKSGTIFYSFYSCKNTKNGDLVFKVLGNALKASKTRMLKYKVQVKPFR